LQCLANELGIAVAVHHLQPGTSQWNEIEHRLFSFISMNWKAKPRVSYRVIVDFIGATLTTAGLTPRCELDSSVDQKGIVVSDQEMESLNITRNAFYEEWNCTILPAVTAIRTINRG